MKLSFLHPHQDRGGMNIIISPYNGPITVLALGSDMSGGALNVRAEGTTATDVEAGFKIKTTTVEPISYVLTE